MGNWNLQLINFGELVFLGGKTPGPAATGSVFASVFGQQQHIAYTTAQGELWDSWYDGPTNSWNLQKLNLGGRTSGPAVLVGGAANVFCASVFRDQQHFAYVAPDGSMQDAWYDGPNSSWNLQQIQIGNITLFGYTGHEGFPGRTGTPSAGYIPFVLANGDQQHFGYALPGGPVLDTFYDGTNGSWSTLRLNPNEDLSGAAASGPFLSVFGDQLHYTYCDFNGQIWDQWYVPPGGNVASQAVNLGGLTVGPPSVGPGGNRVIGVAPFVSVFRDQQHFTYSDSVGTLWDAWYDGPAEAWNLQTINAGGRTNGPLASSLPSASIFGDQHHIAYVDYDGIVWDSWYDGGTGKWNLQQINRSGLTNGPAAAQTSVFVWVYNQQQHFTYVDPGGFIWDAWYDG